MYTAEPFKNNSFNKITYIKQIIIATQFQNISFLMSTDICDANNKYFKALKCNRHYNNVTDIYLVNI